jgi:hypothetical protein
MFYRLISNDRSADDIRDTLVLFKMNDDAEFKAPNGKVAFNYAIELDHIRLKCSENSAEIGGFTNYDRSQNLIFLSVHSQGWREFGPLSAFAMLRDIVCNKQFAGIGVQLTLDNDAFKFVRVQEGGPADNAGIKVGDTITRLDDQSLQGLGLDKVVEKMRGAVDTEVKLTIIRKGEANPITVSARRAMISVRAVQEQPSK